MSTDIIIVRVYDDDQPAGYRVLVDRLWPRGIAKDTLEHDEWDKDVAPSPDLRKRFHDGDLTFHNFSQAYRKELRESEAPGALLDRFADSDESLLVLLYEATDQEQNHSLVLADVLTTLQEERS